MIQIRRVLLLVFTIGTAVAVLARFVDKSKGLGLFLQLGLAVLSVLALASPWLARQLSLSEDELPRWMWTLFGFALAWQGILTVEPYFALAILVGGLGMVFGDATPLAMRKEGPVKLSLSEETLRQIDALEAVAGRMDEAAAQLKLAIDSQADSVDNQSAAIAEIATALSEINVTSQQTSEQAQSVVQSAETSEQISQRGIESVSQNIDGLHRISEQVEAITANIFDLNEQTNQIGEIVATSSELAERSHVLALNASVEAARSGEAGKGFQVVAQEMKSLARQSKQATERIRRILGEIQRATQQVVTATEEGSRRVTAGIHLAQQAGEIIRQLSQVITTSAQSARLIATASRQLSGGIEQISSAMGELTSLTGGIVSVGKNADMAVRSMTELTKQLTGNVGEIRAANAPDEAPPSADTPPHSAAIA